MKVYRLWADPDNYMYLDEMAISANHPAYHGPPENPWPLSAREPDWYPLAAEVVPSGLPAGDIFSFVGYDVFSDKTTSKLAAVLKDKVELAPLYCPNHDESLFAFRVTNVIDALIVEESDILFASDEPGKVLIIHKYKFHKKTLKGVAVFSIPQWRIPKPYVTDIFVAAVEKHKLKGFRFEEIWDSDR
jgi:hypothetical protein